MAEKGLRIKGTASTYSTPSGDTTKPDRPTATPQSSTRAPIPTMPRAMAAHYQDENPATNLQQSTSGVSDMDHQASPVDHGNSGPPQTGFGEADRFLAGYFGNDNTTSRTVRGASGLTDPNIQPVSDNRMHSRRQEQPNEVEEADSHSPDPLGQNEGRQSRDSIEVDQKNTLPRRKNAMQISPHAPRSTLQYPPPDYEQISGVARGGYTGEVTQHGTELRQPHAGNWHNRQIFEQVFKPTDNNMSAFEPEPMEYVGNTREPRAKRKHDEEPEHPYMINVQRFRDGDMEEQNRYGAYYFRETPGPGYYLDYDEGQHRSKAFRAESPGAGVPYARHPLADRSLRSQPVFHGIKDDYARFHSETYSAGSKGQNTYRGKVEERKDEENGDRHHSNSENVRQRIISEGHAGKVQERTGKSQENFNGRICANNNDKGHDFHYGAKAGESITGEGRYLCRRCKSTFAYNSQLHNHLRKECGEILGGRKARVHRTGKDDPYRHLDPRAPPDKDMPMKDVRTKDLPMRDMPMRDAPMRSLPKVQENTPATLEAQLELINIDMNHAREAVKQANINIDRETAKRDTHLKAIDNYQAKMEAVIAEYEQMQARKPMELRKQYLTHNITCYNCGETGHSAKNCPKKPINSAKH